ncbi:MAG: hypothetical protein PUP91_19980 [Rhizonema sp. PD37]|nr:hypothetical protein [Rhizonema sp. PD37]
MHIIRQRQRSPVSTAISAGGGLKVGLSQTFTQNSKSFNSHFGRCWVEG